MRATILVATRNRFPQLRLALPTIAAQHYPEDIETLVVDDASNDETPAFLREQACRVYRIERAGGYRRNPSEVFNIGHGMARGEVVIEQGGEVAHVNDCAAPLLAACRPGVVALATCYNGSPEELARFQEDYRAGRIGFEADVELGPPLETNGAKLRVPRLSPPDGPMGHTRLRYELFCGRGRPVPFLFCGAIHREDFKAVGGYNPASVGHDGLPGRNDQDLAERLLTLGVRFRFVGAALAFHLRHGKG